jgi:hypothetical protein
MVIGGLIVIYAPIWFALKFLFCHERNNWRPSARRDGGHTPGLYHSGRSQTASLGWCRFLAEICTLASIIFGGRIRGDFYPIRTYSLRASPWMGRTNIC